MDSSGPAPNRLAAAPGQPALSGRCRGHARPGRILAESDSLEPLTPGSLITLGFGGRVYFPTDKGFTVPQIRSAATP